MAGMSEIGNGARYLQNTMVGSRGKIKPGDRSFQQGESALVGLAMLFYLGSAKHEIGFALPLQLYLASMLYADSD